MRLSACRPIGAVLIGIRSNERRMEALGYNTVQIKIWAFTVGGALAGFAGALYVHRTSFVSPQIFGFALATNVVLWTLIGGRGTVVGPVIGALAINFASATLADVWLQYWTLATGVIFVVVVVVMPQGVVPSVRRVAGFAAGRRQQPVLVAGEPEAGKAMSASPATSATSATPVTRATSAIPAIPATSATPAGPAIPATGPAPRVSVFEAAEVEKGYGFFRLLDGVTLAMSEPELRCLIGPNGAGKSTLLDILSGHQGCQAGTVRVLGHECTGRRSWEFARHGVSRKFQSPQLIDDLSVGDNLRLSGHPVETHDGVLAMFEASLAGRSAQRAGTLSGGEQKMLAAASALASTAPILLLDEPTEGLQPSNVAVLGDRLEAARSAGRGVLLVEQHLALATRLADRFIVLEKGEIVDSGTAGDRTLADRLAQRLAI